MSNAFSPQRLAAIRRMRQARRLFKVQPLFAFHQMLVDYPAYTVEDFWEDLRYRSRPKRRKGRCPLVAYGRYSRMMQYRELYRSTGIAEYGLHVLRLRKNMTKPYRVLVKIKGEAGLYTLAATIPIERIERLTSDLQTCVGLQEAERLIEDCRSWGSR